MAKRAKISPDLFATTEDAGKPQKKEAGREERKLTRATYYFTPEMKDAIAYRAIQLGVPASQLAMYLLADSLQRYDHGELDPAPFLAPSTSPKFRNNLEFDDWYPF